jgi:hypothetical protein
MLSKVVRVVANDPSTGLSTGIFSFQAFDFLSDIAPELTENFDLPYGTHDIMFPIMMIPQLVLSRCPW